jgi:CHAD domain-containing protein
MLLDRDHIRTTIRKLSRQLSKLSASPTPDGVHKFRTSSRRVEVLVADLARKRSRNDTKLLKQLARLRKKAGRLRDLDVQSSALRSLKIPQQPGRKSQLMSTMAEERARRERKLVKALNKRAVAEVRKRLKRAASELEIPKNVDPLALAMRRMRKLELEPGAVTEKTLHRFRIAGKRARYIAELADKNAESTRLVEQLRHMQDVIGDWHDWLQLTEQAEKRFGGVQDSALVAALRNLTRAKFRQAVHTLTETRAALANKKPVPITSLGRHPERQGSVTAAAVA